MSSSAKLIKIILTLNFVLITKVSSVFADEAIQFNTDVLDATDRSNVDLSRFSSSDYVIPGTYLLDIILNKHNLLQDKITYIAVPGNEKKSTACITPKLLNQFALKKAALDKVNKITDDCLDITPIPGTQLTNAVGELIITIPQVWMKYVDQDWTPPERWDRGVNGLLFDYNLTGSYARDWQVNTDDGALSSYGQAGINIEAWRLRSTYQANYSNQQHADMDWTQFYAFRPIPTLAAKLTLGELYLNSQVFNTVRLTGVNLASEERMLPPSLRGYAPEIRGVAKTNAEVVVSQNGQILYETSVPAGPFNIQQLRNTVRGTLDVTVKEQDGSVSTFQVDTINIPYLTRPGQVRYNMALGKPSYINHKIEGPVFYSGDFSWGVNNQWSLYGGTTLTGKDYNAWSFGVGRNLGLFGAVSTDVTQAFSRLPKQGSDNGMSFKVSYTKNFDDYHGSLSFVGYRFSQNTYRSLPQYLDERYQTDYYGPREKQMYAITASKTFMPNDIDWTTSLYLTYTRQDYWEQSQQERYGASLGHTFRLQGLQSVTAYFSAYRSRLFGTKDDAISLSLSIPLEHSRWIGYDLQSGGGGTSHMLSYSDSRDLNSSWRMRTGVGQDGRGQIDGYYQHRAQLAEISATASAQQGRYIGANGTLRGGFTATRYGAALHNSNSSFQTARMMVDTAGVAGVPINSSQAYSNSMGIAVVPDILSYTDFDTRVDINNLAEDVEVTSGISSSTLTEGAIGYRRFAVTRGEKMLAKIQLADGSYPPFGAEVINAQGIAVSMVMEEGQAYLMGVHAKETLTAVWRGEPRCQVTLPNQLEAIQIKLTCQPNNH